MKCLLCKYGCTIHESVEAYKTSICGGCHSFDKYEEASAEDLVAYGTAIFERKMSLPAYADYKDRPAASERLLNDCIEEAVFRHKINGGRDLCKDLR